MTSGFPFASMTRMGATVLIVDDHVDFREWARALLGQGGYTVLGEVGDGGSAIEAARRLRPEVVLLDVQLPDIDGFEVARRLRRHDLAPVVVLISTRDAADYGDRIANSAALGFLAKDQLSPNALERLIAGRDSAARSPREHETSSRTGACRRV
jgi:CheY-like chemotaxis protein